MKTFFINAYNSFINNTRINDSCRYASIGVSQYTVRNVERV